MLSAAPSAAAESAAALLAAAAGAGAAIVADGAICIAVGEDRRARWPAACAALRQRSMVAPNSASSAKG